MYSPLQEIYRLKGVQTMTLELRIFLRTDTMQYRIQLIEHTCCQREPENILEEHLCISECDLPAYFDYYKHLMKQYAEKGKPCES